MERVMTFIDQKIWFYWPLLLTLARRCLTEDLDAMFSTA